MRTVGLDHVAHNAALLLQLLRRRCDGACRLRRGARGVRGLPLQLRALQRPHVALDVMRVLRDARDLAAVLSLQRRHLGAHRSECELRGLRLGGGCLRSCAQRRFGAVRRILRRGDRQTDAFVLRRVRRRCGGLRLDALERGVIGTVHLFEGRHCGARRGKLQRSCSRFNFGRCRLRAELLFCARCRGARRRDIVALVRLRDMGSNRGGCLDALQIGLVSVGSGVQRRKLSAELVEHEHRSTRLLAGRGSFCAARRPDGLFRALRRRAVALMELLRLRRSGNSALLRAREIVAALPCCFLRHMCCLVVRMQLHHVHRSLVRKRARSSRSNSALCESLRLQFVAERCNHQGVRCGFGHKLCTERSKRCIVLHLRHASLSA